MRELLIGMAAAAAVVAAIAVLLLAFTWIGGRIAIGRAKAKRRNHW